MQRDILHSAVTLDNYIRKRLKFSNVDLHSLKGLVFDIGEFVRLNEIKLDEKQQRLLYFLHTNFVGFVTEHGSCLMLRNVDPYSTFMHYRLQLRQSKFLDYYYKHLYF